MARSTYLNLTVALIAIQPLITKGSESPQIFHHLSYQVKAGDHWGKILDQIGICPLWGSGRRVENAIRLNPSARRGSDPTRIFPGEIVRLPASTLPDDPDLDITPEGMVIFRKKDLPSRCSSTHVKLLARAPMSIATPPLDPNSTQESENSRISGSELTLISRLGFSQFSATDLGTTGTARLASNPWVGMDAEWQPDIAAAFKVFMTAGFDSFSVQTPASRALGNSPSILPRFGLGLGSKSESPLQFKAGVMISEEVFVSPQSSGTLAFDGVAIPRIWSDFSYRVFHASSVSVKLLANVALALPSRTDAYSIHLGSSYGGGVGLEQDFLRWTLLGNIQYRETNQNTSILEQTRSDYLFSFGFRFRYK
jgi:hypothetical protein